jgi:hypothetical protein
MAVGLLAAGYCTALLAGQLRVGQGAARGTSESEEKGEESEGG